MTKIKFCLTCSNPTPCTCATDVEKNIMVIDDKKGRNVKKKKKK